MVNLELTLFCLVFSYQPYRRLGGGGDKEYDQGDSNLRMIPLQSELGENATIILRIKVYWVKVTQ